MPDIEIAVETTSVITVEVERTGPQGPGASVLGRALSGEAITLYGLDNGAGLPGAVLQAQIDAYIAAGVPEGAIGWWSTGTEAAGGAVSDSMGTLSLTASATLALGALSGVRIGTMGALSLTAPATLALGTLAGVEVAAGSASLGNLSLTASSTLSIGTLSGVQNGSMGALGLTAGATLALGTLAGVENSGAVNASMGELALTASATLALGTLAGTTPVASQGTDFEEADGLMNGWTLTGATRSTTLPIAGSYSAYNTTVANGIDISATKTGVTLSTGNVISFNSKAVFQMDAIKRILIDGVEVYSSIAGTSGSPTTESYTVLSGQAGANKTVKVQVIAENGVDGEAYPIIDTASAWIDNIVIQ